MNLRSLIGISLLLVACASTATSTPSAATPSDAERRQKAALAMHDTMLADVTELAKAAADLQAAAPLPVGRGWDPAADAAAIEAMRAAWFRARTAYERTEGALAPLFPDIDPAIDARYDDFLTDLAGQGGDAKLFDGTGVTGMHAVERILFSDKTPARVVEFEKTLPGYVAASFPKTAEEAASFKNELCARLVKDTKLLLDQWTPAVIDVTIAFDGVTSLVTEQREKVNKASSNEEESRYAQRTMTDLRDNLAGTKTAYAIFAPWILAKPGGADVDKKITDGIARLDAAYAKVVGEAIPAPPTTWSAESPSAADLATPFGLLYTSVKDDVDPNRADSIVAQLDLAARLLGLQVVGR